MKFVVIGAGIFGASVAYNLGRSGADVTVIDAQCGGGATSAGAGIVCPWTSRVDNPAHYRIAQAGAHYYTRLVGELAESGIGDIGYRKVGALVPIEGDPDIDIGAAHLRQRAADDPFAGDISLVERSALKDIFPPLADRNPALFVPGGARVEARTVAAAMLTAAEAFGVTRLHGHVDLAPSPEKSRVGATLDGVPLDADAFVITAGAWANQVMAKIGLRIPVVPQKGQILHFRLGGQDSKNWPVVMPQTSYYMLAFEHGRVVVGATRETPDSGFDYRVTAAGQAEVLNVALALAPGLADAELIEARVGFRPWREGLTPLIGKVPGLDNLFVGDGLGPSGLTIGPFAGWLLAQTALGQPTGFDMDAYTVIPERQYST